MSKLKWDDIGEKTYETGVSNGVLYVVGDTGEYGEGVAWNGLTEVNENPSGAEPTALWADNRKYLNLMSAEQFGATIGAYTYPDEFKECDGSKQLAEGIYAGQQTRKKFGFSYKTIIGNDVQGEDYGYKLHIVYGCTAKPSGKQYGTVNDSPNAISFSWEISTDPVEIGPGFKPTATITIDSTTTDPDVMTAIENALYGTDAGENAGQGTAPKLPTPAEILAIING